MGGPERLMPDSFERLVGERLSAVSASVASDEDLQAAIIALRALGESLLPGTFVRTAAPGLRASSTPPQSSLSGDGLQRAIEDVRDLLDNPHAHTEAVHGQITLKISELEARISAEDHGVVILFDAVPLSDKPRLDALPSREKAVACRRWLRENAQLLAGVESVDMKRKGLTIVPKELGLLSRLQRLSLNGNQIQSLRGTVLPASLSEISLNGNQIQSLQDATLPESLETLSLDDNQIQSLQGVALPPFLQWLSFKNNRISSLQGVVLPDSLKRLNLIGNPIQSLQGVVLPAALEIFPENLLLGHRLDGWLRAWNDEYIQRFHSPCVENFDQLSAMDDISKGHLVNYLFRLSETRDYRNGGDSRTNILRRAGNMLRLASTNPQFRDQVMAAITQGLESCGDRVLLEFNDIEILWQRYQENMTEKTVRALAIGQGRYELVKKYALEESRKQNAHDEIEIALYLHIFLRDRLKLPISTQGMLYPAMGEAVITDKKRAEIAKKVLSFSDKDLLAHSPIWEEWQKKYHPTEVERITNFYSELLGQAEEFDNLDDSGRRKYLKTHGDLAKVLRPLLNSSFWGCFKPTSVINKNYSYNEACRLIPQALQIAIAGLSSRR